MNEVWDISIEQPGGGRKGRRNCEIKIDSRSFVWVRYSRFASAVLTASWAEEGGWYLRRGINGGGQSKSVCSPDRHIHFSHKSDVVVIVHLDRRRQQRVPLTKNGPHDPHSLTCH